MQFRNRKTFFAWSVILLLFAIALYSIATPKPGGRTSRLIKTTDGKLLTMTKEFIDCSPLESWICSTSSNTPGGQFGPPRGNRYSLWIADPGSPVEAGTCLWSHVRFSALVALQTIDLLDVYIDPTIMIIAYRVDRELFCDIAVFDPDKKMAWHVTEKHRIVVAHGVNDAFIEKAARDKIRLNLDQGGTHMYLERDANGFHWRKE